MSSFGVLRTSYIEKAKIRGFKELEIWEKGIELVKSIYKATAYFPKNEMYGLVVQMRRCAVSIPSNIAEGFKRRHPKEFKQFLHIALGSLAEIETQTIIAEDLGYFERNVADEIYETADHINRMISNLNKRL